MTATPATPGITGIAGATTWQLLWRLMRYRPWLYLANGTLWALIHVSPLFPGLIARGIFDTLSGSAPATIGVTGLIALYVMTGLGQAALIFGGAHTDIRHRFATSALLRRNLLARIMALPGARALPVATGEALNVFRDDAEQVEDAISWTLDSIGTAIFAAGAIFILLRIDAQIALLVFAPLAAIVATA
ncbi:MAG: ABC transporter transmembrane domain-containing protein, partial [Chloroflexota bacterium]